MIDKLDPHDWEIRVSAGYLHDSNGYGIWISRWSPSTHRQQFLNEHTGWTETSQGEYRSPTVLLKPDQTEELMSRMWIEGARPSKWGHEGEVAGLKDHLADMRRIVSKYLGVELP
jgi:hypothetical protein